MDLITYAVCKKIASGAVTGIADISIKNGTTLVIVTKDGKTLNMNFPTPNDGISIESVSIGTDNHLTCIKSDGTVIDAGVIPTVQGAKGDKGDKGDSAYDIAVKNGFEGTEEDWLDSLGSGSNSSYTDEEISNLVDDILSGAYTGGDTTENGDYDDNEIMKIVNDILWGGG